MTIGVLVHFGGTEKIMDPDALVVAGKRSLLESLRTKLKLRIFVLPK